MTNKKIVLELNYNDSKCLLSSVLHIYKLGKKLGLINVKWLQGHAGYD